METQNSPVVACETDQNLVLGIRTSAQLAGREGALATLRLMVHAIFPGLSNLDPQDPWHLRFSVTEGMGTPVIGLTEDSLNKQLYALGRNPVTGFSGGNIPFQVLVVLRFKPHKIHLEYLLSRLREHGVQEVSMAEPHGLYKGYVVALLYPPRDDVGLKMIEAATREAMSFENVL